MRPATILIPARLSSERLPNKPLLAETGSPLIWHVVESARRALCAGDVIVATDASEIAGAVESRGGRAVLTSADHPNGTSRLAEAADVLGLSHDATVINVQGDEPEIEPGVIDEVARALADAPAGVEMATIASPFAPGEDPASADIVKVVRRSDGCALYFSRSLIPHRRGPTDDDRGDGPLKHVGIYAYSAGFLRRYPTLERTPLEQAERLEQLRVLEHGLSIAVGVCRCLSTGIDTPSDYAAFVARQTRASVSR